MRDSLKNPLYLVETRQGTPTVKKKMFLSELQMHPFERMPGWLHLPVERIEKALHKE